MFIHALCFVLLNFSKLPKGDLQLGYLIDEKFKKYTSVRMNIKTNEAKSTDYYHMMNTDQRLSKIKIKN